MVSASTEPTANCSAVQVKGYGYAFRTCLLYLQCHTSLSDTAASWKPPLLTLGYGALPYASLHEGHNLWELPLGIWGLTD